MNIISSALIFSIFIFGSDFKSLDFNPKVVSENSVDGEKPKNETVPKVSQKKVELQELKENIGKVGNKLEVIVYEVLKDFLNKEFQSDEENLVPLDPSNHLLKETESVTETLLEKYHPAFFRNQNNASSVIDDEVVHSKLKGTDITTSSTTIETPFDSEETSSVEDLIEFNAGLPLETEMDPTSYEYQVVLNNYTVNQEQSTTDSLQNTTVTLDSSAINDKTTENPNQTETTFLEMKNSTEYSTAQYTTSEIPTAPTTAEYKPMLTKLRKRRMIQENPEQSRSVENFIESNPDRNSDLQRSRHEDPMMMRMQHAPEEELKVTPHRRSDGRSTMKNSVRNSANMPKESHKRRKSTSENEQNEDVPEVPRRKKVVPIEDQTEDAKEASKRRKVIEEGDSNINKRLETSPEVVDDTRLGQSFGWGNQQSPNCYEKNGREDALEKQHIEDLKYEVSKLRSVVDLLREQQRLLNSFDNHDKKDLNEQSMLNVLNQLNNKEKHKPPTDASHTNEIDTIKAKHEELEQIKFQLQEAIENLNRTKEILNLEHKKEVNLEEELKTQKTEINWLKLIMENFIIAQTKKKIKETPEEVKRIGDEGQKLNETENHIVGAAFPSVLRMNHHNRTIPSTVRMAEEKLRELERLKSRESFMNDPNDREISRRLANLRINSPKARSSDFSSLGKLLDSISDKQSKTDDDEALQLKLLEAVSDLRKKKEKEHLTKDLLKKLQNGGSEKNDDDDLSQLLKIQKALKTFDSPQSKSDDLDVEEQLKLLQREISKLRPNDDLGFLSTESKGPGDDPVQFQAMLNKLIAGNPQFQGMKLPPITPQQLMQLQKKFNTRPGFVAPGIGAVGGDFGSGSAAGFVNGYSSALGKIGGPYGTYSSPFGPYSSPASKFGPYGKDLDYSSPINSYGAPYGGLGNAAISYGGSGSIGYSGGNGYTGSNGYAAGSGYSGYPASTGYGGSASYSGPGGGYSGPALGLYGAAKAPYTGGLPSGYTSNYSPAPYKSNYGKPQDASYGVNPYSGQAAPYSNYNPYAPKLDQYGSDKQNYGGNNFFQVPQPSSYGEGPPPPYVPSKALDAPGLDKLYPNQLPYAAAPSPYAGDKIEDLKTQIYGLQNAISSYNRPEYTQTPEDRNTIYSLEQQISELKGIVNTLNGYPGDQPNYSPAGASQYEPSGYGAPNPQAPSDGYNRDSEKRGKRSAENELNQGQLEYKDNEQKAGKSRRKRSADETMEAKTGPDMLNRINSIFGRSKDEKRDARSVADNAGQVPGLLDQVTSALRGVFSLDKHENKNRNRRSVEDNGLDERQSSGILDKLTSALKDVLDEEPGPAVPNPGSRPLPRNQMHERSRSNDMAKPHATLQDIKKQIDHLKKQLGHQNSKKNFPDLTKNMEVPIPNQITPFSTRHALLPDPAYNNYNYNYNYGSSGLNQFPSDLSVKPKKIEIFKSIVAKIMDKVIESLPVILQKLFGFAVHELTAYGDNSYGASYGGYGADSEALNVFRNLGVFGYLPIIILRLLHAVSSFIYVLQKNKFLKYFLIPAGIVLAVAGGMVFLIWWMQPSDLYLGYEKSYDKLSYDNGYETQNDYEKSSGQIVKSYGVNEGAAVRTYNPNTEVKQLPYNTNNVPYQSYKPNQMANVPEPMIPNYNT